MVKRTERGSLAADEIVGVGRRVDQVDERKWLRGFRETGSG